MKGAPWWKLIGYIGCIVVMMVCLWILVSGEEAVCPRNEVDADLQRILSMEGGGEPEDRESEDEPDLMPDLMHWIRLVFRFTAWVSFVLFRWANCCHCRFRPPIMLKLHETKKYRATERRNNMRSPTTICQLLN
eukprot:s134_g2.t1